MSERISTERVLEIVLREMQAYGRGWRGDWSDFDGRTLRNQLDSLAWWAKKAARGDVMFEWNEGTRFENERRV